MIFSPAFIIAFGIGLLLLSDSNTVQTRVDQLCTDPSEEIIGKKYEEAKVIYEKEEVVDCSNNPLNWNADMSQY